MSNFAKKNLTRMEDFLSQLNNSQQEAVKYDKGPELVIAGAGSGKTRVLTYKIANLLNSGYEPYRILALTFTNKAAKEMRERISTLVGEKIASRIWAGTFHSIFSRILRVNADRLGFTSNFTIYDSADSKSLIKSIIKDMDLDDKVYKPSSVQSVISNAKNSLISPQAYCRNTQLLKADADSKRPRIYEIYNTYWHRCKVANAMDFDDLLFYTNILLRDNQDVLHHYQEFFKYILVDEYQDTNFAQHLIVLQLSTLSQKICVVGDDAQSIYSFRGANIDNILNLRNQYPTLRTFKLEQNYRSTQNIVNAANSLIVHNKQQIRKNVFSENSVGSKISVIQAYSDYEEGYLISNQISQQKMLTGDSYDEFAILYRTNSQSRILEESLRKRNIPYRIYGGLSFYQRKEIKDVVAYFRMVINPTDEEAIKRIINYPTRGIGETTLKKLIQAGITHNVSLWEVILNPLTYNVSINKGTITKLKAFSDLIQNFIDYMAISDASELAQKIISETGILAELHTDNTPENISKQENISELMNALRDFISTRNEEGDENISLIDFLAEISLATDQDSDDGTGERVTMLTAHASKGLEFSNVYIVGVEEDLFPSANCESSEKEIEEERRLLYVAITRAKNNCVLSYAKSRFRNGSQKLCNPSRFIKDIDSSYLSMAQSTSSPKEEFESYRGYNKPQATHNNQWHSNTENKYTGKNSYTPSYSENERTRKLKRISTSVGNDTSSASSDNQYKIGNVVMHSKFGKGTITDIESNSGNTKVIINFENTGVKSLLTRFAKLEIIK